MRHFNTNSFQQSDTQHPVSFIYCFAVCCNDKCGYAGYCCTGCLYAECPGELATENKILDILEKKLKMHYLIFFSNLFCFLI